MCTMVMSKAEQITKLFQEKSIRFWEETRCVSVNVVLDLI